MIFHHAAPVMKQKCREATLDEAKALLPIFVATWHAYKNAVGIAAPQIGANLRVFVYDANRNVRKGKYGNPVLVVNPEVVARSEETTDLLEGCLSCPGKQVVTKRPKSLTMKFTTEIGTTKTVTATGFEAAVLEHELQHLDGKTILEFVQH